MQAKLYYLEGSIATSEGMPEHAVQDGINAFKRYLQIESDDIKAMNLLTRAYIRAYERDNAISTNRQALHMRPSDFEAREIRDTLRHDPNLGLKFSTKEPYVQTTNHDEAEPTQEPNQHHKEQLLLSSLVLLGAAVIFQVTHHPYTIAAVLAAFGLASLITSLLL
jgi:hypothetical protein